MGDHRFREDAKTAREPGITYALSLIEGDIGMRSVLSLTCDVHSSSVAAPCLGSPRSSTPNLDFGHFLSSARDHPDFSFVLMSYISMKIGFGTVVVMNERVCCVCLTTQTKSEQSRRSWRLAAATREGRRMFARGTHRQPS